MDPQVSYQRLLDAWMNRDWSDLAELAEALLNWLDKGGFPPEPNYPKEMGNEWNAVMVRATCKFALARANNVLDDENEIPSEVPFCLTCVSCQEDGPPTYSDATTNGWQAVQYIPNSISTPFLGICPSCVADDK